MTGFVAVVGVLLILIVAAPAGAESGDKHYCDGCTPPLTYQGGPVLDTNSATGLTVTPIYWAPSGTPYQLPASYESIIDGYVINIAAASGQNTNVYSLDDEYYEETAGAKQYVITTSKRASRSSTLTRFRPTAASRPVETRHASPISNSAMS